MDAEIDKPTSWDGLFELYDSHDVPADFMGPDDREQPAQDRDPFADRGSADGMPFSDARKPARGPRRGFRLGYYQ